MAASLSSLEQLDLVSASNKILDLEKWQLRPSLAIAAFFCTWAGKLQEKGYFRIIFLFVFSVPKEVNRIPLHSLKDNISAGQVCVSCAVCFL